MPAAVFLFLASVMCGLPQSPCEAALQENVTVAARMRSEKIENSSASTVVISRQKIEMSPSVAVDDLLRSVPGFTLFRRTSSLYAHPTSQGASLRGIGGSGAGRVL